MEKKITSFKQIKEIIEPIPANRFIIGDYGDDKGNCCFLGWIHVALSDDKDATKFSSYIGDHDGYGARKLTAQMLKEVHDKHADGAHVNNHNNINGYNEPVIKDRLMHMIEDGIKWEESKKLQTS